MSAKRVLLYARHNQSSSCITGENESFRKPHETGRQQSLQPRRKTGICTAYTEILCRCSDHYKTAANPERKTGCSKRQAQGKAAICLSDCGSGYSDFPYRPAFCRKEATECKISSLSVLSKYLLMPGRSRTNDYSRVSRYSRYSLAFPTSSGVRLPPL